MILGQVRQPEDWAGVQFYGLAIRRVFQRSVGHTLFVARAAQIEQFQIGVADRA
jgi:hypothetical protein